MSETSEPMASPSPQPLPGPAEAGTSGPAKTGRPQEAPATGEAVAAGAGAGAEDADTPDAGTRDADISGAGTKDVAVLDAGAEAATLPSGAVAAPEEDVEAARLRRAKARLVFDDPLYGRGRDDSDRGWGDRPVPRGGSAADLARFLDEKPPHHI